ncbi:Fis family transcriptional regulator [Thermotoga sp. Ku-13t]|uniref:SoxR reducing system RseC family protein n=1 Tax=Thermotoga sp. Ku-13t TaxID=1755813 RepID=UPI0013E9B4B0|nr:SoxR reducing system RseC family protein [Thermotoga sp. Ku-13t]KAF2958793.1 Fis family transcriptional regulator [Thermotoga sp. Ku-13t]
MARETMVVKEILPDRIVLERDRTSMCGKCPAHMICTGDAQKVQLVVEKSHLDLEPGDVVLVETPAVSATRIAFVVYTIPTLLFIAMVIATVKLAGELPAFLLGLISVAVYFLALNIYDRRFRKKFKPRILRIIEKAKPEDPSNDASLRK